MHTLPELRKRIKTSTWLEPTKINRSKRLLMINLEISGTEERRDKESFPTKSMSADSRKRRKRLTILLTSTMSLRGMSKLCFKG